MNLIFRKSLNLLQSRIFQFAFLAIVLVAVFFKGISNPYFLFIHDEYLPLPGHEIWDQFFVNSRVDFGSSSTFALIVTLLDRIYYTFAYLSGLNLQKAQILLYGLKLLAILVLPYLGFRKLAQVFASKTQENVILVSSLWYSFNTYTLIYWHGNAFSLTLLICYALAPLALYWWERVVISGVEVQSPSCESLKDTLILAQILFLMSFALYLFAPFVLLLAAYTIFRVAIGSARLGNIIRRLAWLAATCAPLFAVHLMVGYEMFFLSVGAQNASGGDTNGNMQGGLLYMALMWFTWPIYTYWSPRNVYTFAEYFRTPISILAPFVLYGLILIGAIRQRRNVFILSFTFLLLVFWLLAKGPQEPFGGLYLFLLEYMPGFKVFRSPDTKFGFVIVLSIAVLLMLTGSAIKIRRFVILVGAVVIIQSWPLLTGVAIQGENKVDSHDRVIYIPDEYQQLADYLNSPERSFGYVMTIPANEFARYLLGRGDEHTGQDLIPKMINFPFVHLSEFSGMPKHTYEKLMLIQQTKDYAQLREFAIRYYVLRYDLKVDKNSTKAIRIFLKNNYQLVFQNSLFELYEDKDALPLVGWKGSEASMINPSRIDVKLFPHQAQDVLVQHQNYHPSWHLYAADSTKTASSKHGELVSLFTDWLDTLSFVWRVPVFEETHRLAFGYANAWDISKRAISSDTEKPSLDYQLLTIFYWPQALFCLLATVSLIFAAGYFLVTCAILLIRVRHCRAVH